MKRPKRDEFELGENEVTHKPTGAWFGAYPGRPEIANRSKVDTGDYIDYEIVQIAELLLKERLK